MLNLGLTPYFILISYLIMVFRRFPWTPKLNKFQEIVASQNNMMPDDNREIHVPSLPPEVVIISPLIIPSNLRMRIDDINLIINYRFSFKYLHFYRPKIVEMLALSASSGINARTIFPLPTMKN